jgi:hypothetical protein
VTPERPVRVLERGAELGETTLGRLVSVQRVFEGADALLGSIEQHYVCGHAHLPFSGLIDPTVPVSSLRSSLRTQPLIPGPVSSPKPPGWSTFQPA